MKRVVSTVILIFVLCLFPNLYTESNHSFLSNSLEGCVEGTLIKTPRGYISVEDIRQYDTVISYNFLQQQEVSGVVTCIVPSETIEIVTLTLSNGCILYATPHSKVSSTSREQWIAINELKDRLQSYDINITDISFIEKDKKRIFLITVEPYHNFFVTQEDLLVHNIALSLPIISFGANGLSIFGIAAGSLGPAAILGVALTLGTQYVFSKVVDKLNENKHPNEQYPTEQAVAESFSPQQVVPVLVSASVNSSNGKKEAGSYYILSDKQSDYSNENYQFAVIDNKSESRAEFEDEEMIDHASFKKSKNKKSRDRDAFSCKDLDRGPNGDKDPNDDENKAAKRIINTMTRTEFLKEVKDKYRYYQGKYHILKDRAEGFLNGKVKFLRWDGRHGDVEVLDKNGKHLGSLDPLTKKLYKPRNPEYDM